MENINFKHSIIFFNFCILISPLYLVLNFEPVIFCLFLILILGISHGALDNIKGKKLLRFVCSFFEMYIDDKKLRHNIPIKNSLLKNSASKILKLRILNISLVSSLFNNNGAIITVDPFKKNKNSDMKNFFLKKNTVSSFPK